jgi:formylglycine-generating enzyme required for sulfatase activity
VLYVQLRDYRPDRLADEDRETDLPALAWLQCEWHQETGQAPPLAAFLRQGSLTLLLDGLNEIPRDSDAAYRERVAEWRDLVDAVDRSYPGVQVLFACRPLDYSERLDAGRHTRLPDIEVQPMEPARIRAFIDKRFPRPIAEQVWAQLKDGPALTLYSSPYTLNLLLGQIDPAAAEIPIPQDRAALFSGLVRARLRRECHKGSARCAAPDLLGERDRVVLLSGKPGPHWLPEDTPFFAGLAALAFAIQDASGSNERWGSLRWSKARQAMAAALAPKPDTDSYLHAGCDLGLFEDESAQAGDIRFVHQQIQEYFAAWVLAEHPDPQKLAVPWMSVELARSTEILLAEGGDDALPALPTTGWEESALMAASLSERPEAFIRGLVPANLALAGRCAAAAGARISAALRDQLRRRLIERTQDPQADLRARIAAANALGELGDPRLQEQRVNIRVRPLLPAFAAIAGGTYRIGGDPEGFAVEQPAQDVTLAAFELAVHPVTNAEYGRFLQAGGYREDAYWPGRALAWRDGQIGQDATQQAIRKTRQLSLDALGPDATAEAIRDRYRLSLANARFWQERISESDDAFETWLEEAYPPPQGPFTQPRYWRSPSDGNPAQPVVGVCWYEARAYCLWLNDLLGSEAYRLPSEAEWEAAGRGRGAWRRYAWPGDFDPLRANTAETRLGVTTPVGVFPGGATPDTGLLDLCGNVWEWTATPWTEGAAWAPAAGAADGEPVARRVVRGGSWGPTDADARVGYRNHNDPVDRDVDLGFRVCRASPI